MNPSTPDLAPCAAADGCTTAGAAAGAGARRWTVWGPRLAVGTILLMTALLRLRLLGVPLERDEGEYAYMGQLILRGEWPYLAAHNMKLPGTYYAYAAILGLGGDSDVAIHAALLLLTLACIVLVYLLGRRILSPVAGVAAGAAFAVLSLGPAVFGQAANAEYFVLLPALAGTLIVARLGAERRLAAIAAAGCLLGVAYVMKQPGIVFVAFGGLEVLYTGLRRGRAAWRRTTAECATFAGAALLPFGLTCLVMLAGGAFGAFWFWTVTYAAEYVSIIPGYAGWFRFRQAVTGIGGSAVMLWGVAAVGVTALGWDRETRRAARFLTVFAVCSFAGVCPGLRFSTHYFVLLLPAASLLIGAAIDALSRLTPVRLRSATAVGLTLLAVGSALVQERAYFFTLSPTAVARKLYGLNPFPEAREIARYVRERTRPDERIAVIGSEPQIYFYAQRRAATTYLYMYPLMEPQAFAEQMQTEMIAQLERDLPIYLIFVGVHTSWILWPDSPRLLSDWVTRTVNEQYRLVGLVEMFLDRETRYRWDAEAEGAQRQSSYYVSVFRRR